MRTDKPDTPAALLFYASQSGGATLDEGEGGGNPFASALIELLQRPSVTLLELHSDIVTLTTAKSDGFQVPDAPTCGTAAQWTALPVPPHARRVALVFVFADYRQAGVNSLPGASRDLERVAAALEKAGFSVQAIVDPTAIDLGAALALLAEQSDGADSAVIYATGHGVERDGQVYLLPNDHRFHEPPGRIPDWAIHVPSLGQHLRAKCANIVFFEGCRTLA